MTPHEKAVEAAEQAGDATLFDDNTHWSAHYTAAIAAYLASMEAQGWVMVPREATDDMVDAARHFLEPQTERIGRACYRAMIDTAMLAANEGQP